jgi:DNA-binding NarL/FixJ family response regulator
MLTGDAVELRGTPRQAEEARYAPLMRMLAAQARDRGKRADIRASSRPLTQRESEVAVLLVEGCSDAVIASRLGVSVRTASWHVRKVLSRLAPPRSSSDAC